MWDIISDASGNLALIPQGDPVPEGWTIVGNTVDPNALDPPVPTVEPITHFAFLNRFTDAELIGIELAQVHNPSATAEQQYLAAHLRMHQHKFNSSAFVDLAHPQTIAGVTGLEEAGLIGTGRASVILTTPITDEERP